MTTKLSKRIPKFRHHKATGQGYVVLNGRQIYLGRYDKQDTQQRYHQVVSEWLANNQKLPISADEITVVELCAVFWKHAESYYQWDGEPTGELHPLLHALKYVKTLYGHIAANEFGPRSLKTVRQIMISDGLSRSTINSQIGRIKRIFKWAASNELIDAAVYQALNTVEGLRAGRTEALESKGVRPVPESHVEAVLPLLSRQVAALVRLQLLTAARSGELLKLRPIDLDTTGRVWTATLKEHKTRYKGRERTLYFGPKAQAILKDFLADRPLDAYLFSPSEAEKGRHAHAPTHRRSNQIASPRKTTRIVGEHYTTASYRRAIERGCRRAGAPVWTPHRLRHNAATHIRKEFGLEAAQLLLGHARADVTQLYAESDQSKALVIVQQIG